jgi:transposase
MTEPNLCPHSSKRIFATEQEALDLAQKLREQHTGPQQFPYLCEDCGNWHLTCTPRGSHNTVADYARLENAAPRKRVWHRTQYFSPEEMTKALELRSSGLTCQDIARHFNRHVSDVYKSFARHRENRLPTVPPSKPVETIDSLAAKEHELEAALARTREEKLRRIDAERVKLETLADGRMQIRKNTQILTITQEDAINLLSLLETELDKQTGGEDQAVAS